MMALESGAPSGFREPPHNLDAEMALVGGILYDNDLYSTIANFLRAEHFYEPVLGRMYRAAGEIIEDGGRADHITLLQLCAQDDALKEIDSRQWVGRLAEAGAVFSLSLPEYARTIYDLALKRALIHQAEQLVNAAHDASSPRASTELLGRAQEVFDQLSDLATKGRLSTVRCTLPTIDYSHIAEGQIAADRWLIDEWLPIGTAGVLAGPGAAGKSFLEIMRMICLATGTPFLGYELQPCPVLGYFAEDDQRRLELRVQKICRGLGIDPRDLRGRCEIVSLTGHNKKLFRADRNAYEVEQTAWYDQVLGRAQVMGARYISFDHVGRLASINRNDPTQVFDMWGRLDTLAHAIDGCVCMLAHPSKSDLRAGKGPRVGGAVAMIDAPRWVHILDWSKHEEDDENDGDTRFRVLTNDKPNYVPRRFAIKLEENPSTGLVECKEEVDPDNPGGKPRGRPSTGRRRTVDLLREMYERQRQPIPLDELVAEAIARDIIAPAEEGDKAWRHRRTTIRRHLEQSKREVDDRGDNLFAVKP